jgi:hypothetical protein
LGADAVLATESGTDTYGRLGVATVPFVAWRDRRHDDVCVIPDVYSRLADDVQGDAIVYEQHPLLIRADFDHLRPNVRLWTCSPLMVERCGALLPGKEPAFVPNIVDPVSFPFVEQHRRRAGRLAALPRKGGMAFIRAAYGRYRAKGGRYWQLDLIDRLPFTEFAARYREPQAFLPATDVEGCGLPAMEAMAAGIAVAGKNGGGASFYMPTPCWPSKTRNCARTYRRRRTKVSAISFPRRRQPDSGATSWPASASSSPSAAPARSDDGAANGRHRRPRAPCS